ncbi:exported hypothetical protein [metagenome]|uniref:Endonuclease/exonuclease/phosphatase domain-containing protein n=1 Tax=metagenome TaxID=256318 RepID=A0A2P2C741_9ZZZZ
MPLARPRTLIACTLAAVSLSLTGVAPAPATPVSSTNSQAASTLPVRIGTYNILCTVGTATFRSAVEGLVPRVDVAGLQEVNSHEKEAVLASLSSSGWAYWRSEVDHAEQNPVIWNTNRFRLLGARVVKLNEPGWIGNERPGPNTIHTMYASVVHLRDLATDQDVSIVNTHLVAGAVKAGRMTPGRKRLFNIYREQVRSLADLTRTERAWGNTFVMGDLNVGWVADERERLRRLPFMTFRRQSMPSMWRTQIPSANRGTHENALIDQIYYKNKAASTSVEFDLKYSDHRPAIATYNLDVLAAS